MKPKTTKRVTLALGAASVAASIGNAAVKAGPALQTLNNVTNTAEFTINNTYGQSFSVDGVVGSNLSPFAAGALSGVTVNFQAGPATLSTGFSGSLSNFNAVSTIVATSSATAIAPPVILNTGATGLGGIVLTAASTTQTLGASISSTLFGPSTVRGSTSFTNQLINDLSAF